MGNLIFIPCSLSISKRSWRRRSRTCHGKWREQTLMREESRVLTIEGWEMKQKPEAVVNMNTRIKNNKNKCLSVGSGESDAHCWAEETDAAEGFPRHLNIRSSNPHRVHSSLNCLGPFSPKIPSTFFCQNSTLHLITFCPSPLFFTCIVPLFKVFFPLLLILSFISAPFLLSNLYSAAGFENSMIVQGFTYADIASPRQLTLHMHAHTQNTPLKQSFLPPLLLP